MASFCSQSAWEPGGPKRRTYMRFASGIYNLELKSIFQLGIYFLSKIKSFYPIWATPFTVWELLPQAILWAFWVVITSPLDAVLLD